MYAICVLHTKLQVKSSTTDTTKFQNELIYKPGRFTRVATGYRFIFVRHAKMKSIVSLLLLEAGIILDRCQYQNTKY